MNDEYLARQVLLAVDTVNTAVENATKSGLVVRIRGADGIRPSGQVDGDAKLSVEVLRPVEAP